MHLYRGDLVSSTKYSTVLLVLLLTALKFFMPLGVSLIQSLHIWFHTDLLIWGKMKQNILYLSFVKTLKH